MSATPRCWRRASLKFRYGKAGQLGWELADLKDECKALQEQAADAAAQFTEATLRPLAYWIAAARRSRGPRARRAPAGWSSTTCSSSPASCCAARPRPEPTCAATLHDAVPAAAARRVPGHRPDPDRARRAHRRWRGADADDWRDVDGPAGSLFVVGDPKQSIYRFRRADIATYLGAQESFGERRRPADRPTSAPCQPILDWVNAVFAELITPHEDAQPTYEALDARRQRDRRRRPRHRARR